MKRISKEDLRVVTRLGYGNKRSESAAEMGEYFPDSAKNRQIIEMAQQCYNGTRDVRKRTVRNRKFYRGEQWGDFVEVNGKRMTEGEYIKMQGKPALVQNLIRPPLRNILGQYRSNPFKSTIYSRNRDDQSASEMMTVAFESVYQMNDGKERDARMLETYLLSGVAIYNTSYSFDEERMRTIPKFKATNINRFFIDVNMEDVCGDDIAIIGEIADVTLLDLIATYARNKAQEEEIRAIYAGVKQDYNKEAFDTDNYDNLNFLTPSDTNLCRVIQVQVKEGSWRLLAHDYADATLEMYDIKDKPMLDAENAARKRMAAENGVDVPLIEYEEQFMQVWKYYHLTPNGYALWQAECPYAHNSHSYVFKFYPMLDGAVWSMVEDLIDQQKMVNRMVILQEFIMSASAKGVLLVPEEAIPDDMDLSDFADEWVKYNGVIKIKSKTKKGAEVPLPKQVVASAVNVGATDMINLQMRLMQDIGGVHGASQGKTPASGTPAALYAQESANATINILDYLESFGWFTQKRDYKIIQIIKQFDQEKHYQAQGATNVSEGAKTYDPDLIRNIDFDNSISKANDTPTFRMIVDDMLWKMLESQFIGIEMFLEHSSLPFSDKLLASIKSQKEQLGQGTDMSNFTPEMVAQLQGQVPPSTPQGAAGAERLYYGNKKAS